MSWKEFVEERFDLVLKMAEKDANLSPWFIQARSDFLHMAETLDISNTENERLTAIVNLIDLKNERDELAAKLAALTNEKEKG